MITKFKIFEFKKGSKEDLNENWFLYVHQKNLKLMKKYIDYGLDINIKNWFNDTALLICAKINYFDGVIFLIDNNANMFIKDEFDNYFIDYLNYQQLKIFKNKYPEKYNELEKRKNLDKFNI